MSAAVVVLLLLSFTATSGFYNFLPDTYFQSRKYSAYEVKKVLDKGYRFKYHGCWAQGSRLRVRMVFRTIDPLRGCPDFCKKNGFQYMLYELAFPFYTSGWCLCDYIPPSGNPLAHTDCQNKGFLASNVYKLNDSEVQEMPCTAVVFGKNGNTDLRTVNFGTKTFFPIHYEVFEHMQQRFSNLYVQGKATKIRLIVKPGYKCAFKWFPSVNCQFTALKTAEVCNPDTTTKEYDYILTSTQVNGKSLVVEKLSDNCASPCAPYKGKYKYLKVLKTGEKLYAKKSNNIETVMSKHCKFKIELEVTETGTIQHCSKVKTFELVQTNLATNAREIIYRGKVCGDKVFGSCANSRLYWTVTEGGDYIVTTECNESYKLFKCNKGKVYERFCLTYTGARVLTPTE